ncbi:PIH1 domain-containing protein 1 [Apophysomyces sp. BC1034]|nr:PIH1 domain-containing protein 1 [Apophysomyces sp. BC1015]KAG0179046.1 PIH1 domain-containing protein 1 [Apophysomyces sp. BC1021]KAG0189238.1 PIH1 domain-containing protein 1 [Apophysomyces sp. BC1034]
MPTLEPVEDSNPLLLSQTPALKDFNALSKEEQNAVLDNVAAEFSSDPAALQRLASTVLGQASKDDFNTVTIQPQPGFVCKTQVTSSKNREHNVGKIVYINICHASAIPEPTLANEAEIQKALNGEPDATYRVPLSMGQPRFEKNNAGETYLIMDACIHPQPYLRAERDLDYRLYILELAMEHVEENQTVTLGREFTMPNMAAKGQIPKRILRLPKPSLISAVKQEKGISAKIKPSVTMLEGGKRVNVVIPMPSTDPSPWVVNVEHSRLLLSGVGDTMKIPLPCRVHVDHTENIAEFYKRSKHLVIQLMVDSEPAPRQQYL